MEYYDEELLELKNELERKKYVTLETGIYVGEELITFVRIPLPDSQIYLFLPDQFVVMPEVVKNIKYPSKDAPDYIITSLDGQVNFCFNLLEVQDGAVKDMSRQFQDALQNINPSVIIKNQTDTNTNQGNAMSWFGYKGYLLDGQSYNRIYLVKMRKSVLHGIFNCQLQDKQKWEPVVDQMFAAIEEVL